jgi:hypothetical protein
MMFFPGKELERTDCALAYLKALRRQPSFLGGFRLGSSWRSAAQSCPAVVSFLFFFLKQSRHSQLQRKKS